MYYVRGSKLKQCLFPVFRTHTAHHLHDQHGGRLSPPAAQGDQEQRSLPERHRPGEAGFPGLHENPAQVDAACPELGADSPATGHPLPGPLPDSDLKESRGDWKNPYFCEVTGASPRHLAKPALTQFSLRPL